MDSIGSLFLIGGGIITLIGAIRLIIAAFSSSILWGLGVIFIHPLMLVYVLLNWSEAKGPFLNYLAGVALMIVGGMMAG